MKKLNQQKDEAQNIQIIKKVLNYLHSKQFEKDVQNLIELNNNLVIFKSLYLDVENFTLSLNYKKNLF